MSSVSSVRIPGLATGMDTDSMVKEMLTGDQSKIDKVDQKKQTSTWQQESYREIITNVKGFYDKYFSATSPDFILSSKVFGTTTVTSANSNIISAVAGAGANNINYNFEIKQLATAPEMSSKKATNGVEIKKDSKLSELGLDKVKNDKGEEVAGEVSFKINYGKDKESKPITITSDDTVESMIKKINDSTSGEIKASYSEMTGSFTITSKTTGESSTLKIVNLEKDKDGKFTETDKSDALGFIGIDGAEKQGEDSKVKVTDSAGNVVKEEIKNSSNTFTIDNITYTLKGTTKPGETVDISSQTDTKQTVDKMKSFLDEYNKMMDEVYKNVTEKKNKDYPPLTAAQKEEMSEEEIEKWETKAKVGILRNDKELRTFMDDIKSAIFGTVGDTGLSLSDTGIKSDEDYNKPGQLQIDVDKFTKALEENGDLVYKVTTGAFEKVKDVVYKNVGSSSGALVKKAGIEKSSTTVNNLFSQQIKKQEEQIKALTVKMQDKETALYKKFARLESSMNKFNAQMSTLTGLMGQ